MSPTNLSMFSSPVTTPRSTPRSTPVPRWSAPFIGLDEEYNIITPLMAGNGGGAPPGTHEASSGQPLIDDGTHEP